MPFGLQGKAFVVGILFAMFVVPFFMNFIAGRKARAV